MARFSLTSFLALAHLAFDSLINIKMDAASTSTSRASRDLSIRPSESVSNLPNTFSQIMGSVPREQRKDIRDRCNQPATMIPNFLEAENSTIIATPSKMPKITSLPTTFSITKEIYREYSREMIAYKLQGRLIEAMSGLKHEKISVLGIIIYIVNYKGENITRLIRLLELPNYRKRGVNFV
ncbi:hypothetical protein F5882DRAFT_444448 [Hyaloscypha sp. PMI_1271]|nr:hypothetical protein F5882DRAFT_444448 [Hyaloscypha sp. PMI_1271]